MNNLGVLCKETGRIDESAGWYRSAIEVGDPDAMFNLGVLFYENENRSEAQVWWLRAAERGDVRAIHNLDVSHGVSTAFDDERG